MVPGHTHELLYLQNGRRGHAFVLPGTGSVAVTLSGSRPVGSWQRRVEHHVLRRKMCRTKDAALDEEVWEYAPVSAVFSQDPS